MRHLTPTVDLQFLKDESRVLTFDKAPVGNIILLGHASARLPGDACWLCVISYNGRNKKKYWNNMSCFIIFDIENCERNET